MSKLLPPGWSIVTGSYVPTPGSLELHIVEGGKDEIFGHMLDVIRSGQVPEECVPQIMEENPDFAKWYKERSR